jgi:serine protease inhibitor
MRKPVIVISVLTLATILLVSCRSVNQQVSDKKSMPGIIEMTEAQLSAMNSNNDFSIRIFKEVAASEQGSVLISPLSATYALGMLANGAQGDTRREIVEGLGFGNGDVKDVNTICHRLMTDAPRLDKSATIDIANAVVVNQRHQLRTDFKKTVRKQYDALVENKDFGSPATLSFINNWAKEKTHGMIPKVLNEVDPMAVTYLMNAVYFKGMWASKFDKAQTKTESFVTESGDRRQVPMMHRESRHMANTNDIYKTVVLPYGNGSYNMVILLPHEGKTVNDVLGGLSAETWRDNLASCSNREVDLKLPRFSTTYQTLLNKPLSNIGMRRMFDSRQADLSALCDGPTAVSDVLQSAKIELDEEGTRAAAVTTIMVRMTSMAPSGPMEFHADRPFVYAITEGSTGAIFFMGVYRGD